MSNLIVVLKAISRVSLLVLLVLISTLPFMIKMDASSAFVSLPVLLIFIFISFVYIEDILNKYSKTHNIKNSIKISKKCLISKSICCLHQ